MRQDIAWRIRTMLAAELYVDEAVLTDDYRWLDAIGNEDGEWFLARVNGVFAKIPSGFSFGEGDLPIRDLDADGLERIATVRGLIACVEQHANSADAYDLT